MQMIVSLQPRCNWSNHRAMAFKGHRTQGRKADSFIHSFILETYIATLQETTTQRRSQPSHGQKRRTSERCKILKGGSSARNVAKRGGHSMLMDPQPKRPFAA